jgi:hypothetical protein
MATYEYFVDNTGWNDQYLRGKIYAHFNSNPTDLSWFLGCGQADGVVNIYTSRDLTPAEKTTLDNFFATKDGLRPDTKGWTLAEIPNFIADWKTMEAATGVNFGFCFMNDQTGKFEIWILGNVNTSTRTKFLAFIRDNIVVTKFD